jgi:Na+/H+ antiporter NhaA
MGAMAIVLFAVCALFGVLAVVLWAALSSTRVRLARAEAIIAAVFPVVRENQPLSDADRLALALRIDAWLADSPTRRA